MECHERKCRDDDCVICLDPLHSARAVTTTPCGHTYHVACILEHVQASVPRDALCPVCRRPLAGVAARVPDIGGAEQVNSARGGEQATTSPVTTTLQQVMMQQHLLQQARMQRMMCMLGIKVVAVALVSGVLMLVFKLSP